MARPATGQVIEKQTTTGTIYAIRFRAFGNREYVTLGSSAEGWTRARAEEELAFTLGKVRRGDWQRPQAATMAALEPDPTFHEFASEWFARKERELRPSTAASYKLHLVSHLLPFFAGHRLTEIKRREVLRYIDAKLREGRISHETINKTVTRLGQILEEAVEDEDMLLTSNPARGKRVRLKTTRPRPVHLDATEQVVALLDAAGELDRRKASRTSGRRPLVAVLAFAGLRAHEVGDLLWRDVDLAAGRIYVGRSKTDAGMREVDLLPVLRDELLAHKTSVDSTALDDLVFPTEAGGTRGGRRRDKDNIAKRVLRPTVDRADELLAERDQHPLPAGVSPHKLRHTFASILTALGRDPAYVMNQLGHTDPRFTLRVYTHMMRRGDGDRDALRSLVDGGLGTALGTSDRSVPDHAAGAPAGADSESRTSAGDSENGPYWARTSDLRLVEGAHDRQPPAGKPHHH